MRSEDGSDLVASGGVDEAVVIRRRAQQRRSVGGRAVPVAEHLDRHHVIAFTLDGAGWRALTRVLGDEEVGQRPERRPHFVTFPVPEAGCPEGPRRFFFEGRKCACAYRPPPSLGARPPMPSPDASHTGWP